MGIPDWDRHQPCNGSDDHGRRQPFLVGIEPCRIKWYRHANASPRLPVSNAQSFTELTGGGFNSVGSVNTMGKTRSMLATAVSAWSPSSDEKATGR